MPAHSWPCFGHFRADWERKQIRCAARQEQQGSADRSAAHTETCRNRDRVRHCCQTVPHQRQVPLQNLLSNGANHSASAGVATLYLPKLLTEIYRLCSWSIGKHLSAVPRRLLGSWCTRLRHSMKVVQ